MSATSGLIRYEKKIASTIMKNRYVSDPITTPRKSLTARSTRTITTTRTIERADGEEETRDTRWICSDFSPRIFSLVISSSSFLSFSFAIIVIAVQLELLVDEQWATIVLRIILQRESMIQSFKLAGRERKVTPNDNRLAFVRETSPVSL